MAQPPTKESSASLTEVPLKSPIEPFKKELRRLTSEGWVFYGINKKGNAFIFRRDWQGGIHV